MPLPGRMSGWRRTPTPSSKRSKNYERFCRWAKPGVPTLRLSGRLSSERQLCHRHQGEESAEVGSGGGVKDPAEDVPEIDFGFGALEDHRLNGGGTSMVGRRAEENCPEACDQESAAQRAEKIEDRRRRAELMRR